MLIKIEREIRNIVEAVKAGMFAPAMKDELVSVEERNSPVTNSLFDQAASCAMMMSIAVSPSMAEMTAIAGAEAV